MLVYKGHIIAQNKLGGGWLVSPATDPTTVICSAMTKELAKNWIDEQLTKGGD
jgi:hypothetical protein